jgi:hypothetical protein
MLMTMFDVNIKIFISAIVSLMFCSLQTIAEKLPAEKNLRLADRILVHSILTEIFGKSEQQLLREQVLYQNQAFGGPCDVYEQVRIANAVKGVADLETICANGRRDFTAQVITKPNMLRYGYTSYVCKQLTLSKVAMKFALDKIFVENKVQAPNKESVKKAYNLFNPEKDIDANALLSRFDFGTEKSALEQWSEVFFVLCSDPSWQII